MRESPQAPADFDPTFLDEDQLYSCLREMRKRGWAVAAYDIDDIMMIVEESPTPATEDQVRAWFEKDYLEDLMSDAVNRTVDDWLSELEGAS